MSCIASVLAMVNLFYYYDAMQKCLRAKGMHLSPGLSLISLKESRLLLWFIIDLAILLPQPVPYISTDIKLGNSVEASDGSIVYDTNTIFLSAMFLRVIFIPRIVAAGSVLQSEAGHRASRFYDVEVIHGIIASLASGRLRVEGKR